MRIVEQQIDFPARLIDGAAADAAVIAVLVDEALALDVDENPMRVAFGHGPGAGGEELLHVHRIAACTETELDPHAIVLVADGVVELESFRAILAPHLFIENEPAGGQNHALTRLDEARLIINPHHKSDNSVCIADKRKCPGWPERGKT